jgi:hypothetical protein
LAHRAEDAGRPLRVEQDGPATPAHDLVLHTCNRRRREQEGNEPPVATAITQPDRLTDGSTRDPAPNPSGRRRPVDQPTNPPRCTHPNPTNGARHEPALIRARWRPRQARRRTRRPLTGVRDRPRAGLRLRWMGRELGRRGREGGRQASRRRRRRASAAWIPLRRSETGVDFGLDFVSDFSGHKGKIIITEGNCLPVFFTRRSSSLVHAGAGPARLFGLVGHPVARSKPCAPPRLVFVLAVPWKWNKISVFE